MAKFTVNNKIYTVTEVYLFIANYNRELRMGANIRKKGKVEKTMEFTEKIKKIQKKARVVLRNTQKNIKRQADRERKEVKK